MNMIYKEEKKCETCKFSMHNTKNKMAGCPTGSCWRGNNYINWQPVEKESGSISIDMASKSSMAGLMIDMDNALTDGVDDVLAIDARGDVSIDGNLVITGDVKKKEKERDLKKEAEEKKKRLEKLKETRKKLIEKCFKDLDSISKDREKNFKRGIFWRELNRDFIKYVNTKEHLNDTMKKTFENIRSHKKEWNSRRGNYIYYADLDDVNYVKLKKKLLIDLTFNKWKNIKCILELTDKYKTEYNNMKEKEVRLKEIDVYEKEYDRLTGRGITSKKKVNIKVCEACACENLLRSRFCAFCGEKF